MECSIYIDPVLNTSFRFMVLMLTEKFEIDKLLIEKSTRKTNSCYERHKFCTLLDIYFDLKCNKAWVKEEAGFWIYSYSSQQDRCQIFLFFFFNQIFWFSEIPERTTYAFTAGMRLILVRDHFSPVHCYFIFCM